MLLQHPCCKPLSEDNEATWSCTRKPSILQRNKQKIVSGQIKPFPKVNNIQEDVQLRLKNTWLHTLVFRTEIKLAATDKKKKAWILFLLV